MVGLFLQRFIKRRAIAFRNVIYYGVFNARDSVQADVKLFKRNSTMVCDGVMFFDSTRKAILANNKRVPANMSLGCNDGTVIEGNWLVRRNDFTKGRGQGIDQFNNIYDFDSVSRYEFRKNVKQKLVFVNDKSTDNYLKYYKPFWTIILVVYFSIIKSTGTSIEYPQ